MGISKGELTMKYQVEYRNDINPSWLLDDEFESLDEAMSYATGEALLTTDYEYRVTMQVVVATIPPLEAFV